ncbi:TetR/AcrR family transcriptional regulator [Advenella sp. FME57]|uniref:TetR/AcrR family transcriptional regulator n=1 Tax=Advenella sp. FME57 TaxID=2742604 RepID=UPI001865DF56|nr:TetR/AcrR family transcriptional regulator [Advenella sp. FME57]
MTKQQKIQRKRISKHPDVRREELLQTASTLFKDKGIAATGVGDITDRAMVARGTFYLYFSSKDEVVAELWKRYVQGFLSTTHDMTDPDLQETGTCDNILSFLAHLTQHALANAHLHRLVYGTADAPALALCKQSDELILAKLTGMIEAYNRREKQESRNADLQASLIFHGIDGALHQAIMPGVPIDQNAFLAEVKGLTLGVLGKTA